MEHCSCDEGYAGERCERVDFFYLRGDTGWILVICLTAVMVTLIILVVGVCTAVSKYFKFKVNLRNGRYPADSFLLFALISIKHFSRIAIIYIKHLLILKHMVHGIFHFTGQNYHNLK